MGVKSNYPRFRREPQKLEETDPGELFESGRDRNAIP